MIFGDKFEKDNDNISMLDVVEHIADGIIVTNSLGKIKYLNKSAQVLTGWQSDDALNQDIETVFDIANIKTRKKSDNPVKIALIEMKSTGLENNTVLHQKGGEYFYVSASITPIISCSDVIEEIVIVFRDITRHKRREHSLKFEKEYMEKYQALLMNMKDGFSYQKILFDKNNEPFDSKIIDLNNSFAEMVGATKDELIGLTFSQLLKETAHEAYDFIDSYRKVGIDGQSIKMDDVYLKKLDKWVSIYIYSTQKGYFAMIFNDVTTHKKAQDEIIRSRNATEMAYKAKSQFLATMSHEIRTPINGIIGMTDLTLMTELTKEQKENLQIVKTCADTLLNLINDILDFSKFEAGKLSIAKTQFDLQDLVMTTVKIHMHPAQIKGITINTSFQSPNTALLRGDPNRVQQILNNLLSNAIKFTEDGKIDVHITQLANNSEFQEFMFTIKDTGIGIAKEDMDKLFKPFSQVDGSFIRKQGGTGLGLSICKQLVEMMGGSIWVESEPGKGSKFYFTIKLDKDTKNYQQNVVPTIDIYMKNNVKGKNILLAEDDVTNQIVLQKIAVLYGFELDIACDGAKALKKAEARNYDLILLDLQMPEMDGIQVCEKIRKKEGDFSHTPIVALTAHALSGSKEMLISKGMDDFLAKPFNVDDLLKVIVKNLKSKNEVANLKLLPSLEILDEHYQKLLSAIKEKNEQSSEKHANILREIASGEKYEDIRFCVLQVLLDIRRDDFTKAENACNDLGKMLTTLSTLDS